MKKLNFKKFFGFGLAILVIFAILLAIAKGREIEDFFKARDYRPTSKMSEIISKISLTDRAKQIFFATNPQLLGAEDFNQNCRNALEKTAILGCYSDDEIFIYDIDNSELNGIKEVTSAHELLHAAWQRMSIFEREKIGKILRKEYEKLKNPDFEELMKSYEISEPGEHENELHSIIGTEYRDLSPELEEYYARFFANRQEIVRMNGEYKSKFSDLENRAEKLSGEIKNLEKEIVAGREEYEKRIAALDGEISTFNQRAKNGFYESSYAFSNDRSRLLVKSEALEAYREKVLNAKIVTYNEKVGELAEISKKIQRLNDSINSNSKIEQVEGGVEL